MNQWSDIIDVNTMLMIMSDLWTLSLTIAGTLVSIITLLYSLALGKKDELLLIMDLINYKSNKDPSVIAKKESLIKYIEKLKRFIMKCMILFMFSIAIFTITWIECKIEKSQETIILVGFIITMILCTIGGIRFIILLVEFYRQHRKELTL